MNARIQQNDEASSNAGFVPPWEKSNAFHEKPVDQEYGYYFGGKFTACSREELIAKCKSRDWPQVNLVWCPEVPRVTPAVEIDFLSAALRERTMADFRVSVVVGLVVVSVYGLLMLLTARSYKSLSWQLIIVLSLGVIPLVNGLAGLRKLKQAGPGVDERSVGVWRYSAWVASRKILFTWLLLGAIGAIFLLECVMDFGRAVILAGLNKPAVWHGEWWRLFTAPLLHGNPMHFIFNALTLIGLGRLTEVLASRFHLALVFALAALTGSVFSLLLLPGLTSVGASGGLLGLIGFLAVLGIRRKQSLPPGFAKSIAINITLLAAMGIMAFSVIDNAAHLGGLIAGLVLGWFFVGRNNPCIPLETSSTVKIGGIIALLVVLSFAVFAGLRILSH